MELHGRAAMMGIVALKTRHARNLAQFDLDQINSEKVRSS
jgi:hypothetical protein